MSVRRRRARAALAVLAGTGLAMAGCKSAPPVPPKRSSEPIGVQLLRAEPQLRQEKFSTLLPFESPSDAVFARADVPAAVSQEQAHTGNQSLKLAAGTRRLDIELGSLLIGRPFPSDWTLIVGYLYAERPTRVDASYEVDGATLSSSGAQLPAGKWTPVQVDLTAARTPADARPTTVPSTPGRLVYTFTDGAPGAVYCDDVMLVNNDATLVDSTGGGFRDAWTVRRHGLTLTIERPGGLRKDFALAGKEATGWDVVEADEIRVRLHCNDPGPVRDQATRDVTVYADGRTYNDGKYSPEWVVADPWADEYASSHAEPASLQVPPEMGRLDRNTPGDANNDAYNEIRGSYELVSFGRHIQVKIIPHGGPLARPVFEIAGIPAGKVLATLEGQLVETYARLPNGNLLVEVNARVLRPATLDVRVE